eukprot:2058143-Rhodomonas_salina.1
MLPNFLFSKGGFPDTSTAYKFEWRHSVPGVQPEMQYKKPPSCDKLYRKDGFLKYTSGCQCGYNCNCDRTRITAFRSRAGGHAFGTSTCCGIMARFVASVVLRLKVKGPRIHPKMATDLSFQLGIPAAIWAVRGPGVPGYPGSSSA